jgi:hypothetical protein
MSFEVITKLRFNPEQATYSIVQASYRYTFPESLMDDFKKYIIQYHLVSGWYEKNKDQVTRTSIYDL